MTPIVTIAHLSDAHLAPISGFTMRYWNAKRALGLANWHRGRVRVHLRDVADKIAADVRMQTPTHIAVTGDLANLGLPEEYRTASAWLARLGPPDQVSVVPGNHDIYSGRLHGASCLTDWADYMRSDVWSAETLHVGTGFPYVRRIGNVALIGVNSAVPTPPFVAAGHLGAAQIAALANVLERMRIAGLVRVVMIHHPPLPGQAPNRRALTDAAELKAVLERCGADLVLHGHNHTSTTVWLPSAHGAVLVCGIPSASAAIAHKDEPLAQYALYRFEHAGAVCAPLTIHRVIRGITEANGEVIELDRSDLSAST